MPFTKVNGININYRIVGQGEPLVMIMGLGTDQSGWSSQVSFFGKHYQVLTFDNRGVGKSDKPAGEYTMRVMADDCIGLMDHLGLKKAHILGISMGGMIAQEIAINYPERVSKLILGSTFACDDGVSSGETPEWAQAMESGIQAKVRPMVSLMFNRNFYKFVGVPILKMQIWRMGPSGKAGFMAQRAAIKGHQALDRLSLIKSPTLVIVGTKDRVVKPTSSALIADKISGAKLVKLEGGSHVLPLEMKNIFNKEVWDFLKIA